LSTIDPTTGGRAVRRLRRGWRALTARRTVAALALAIPLVVAAVLVALALPAAGQPPGGGAQGPPPAPVRVATAKRVSLAPTTTVPGTVASRFDARVAAEVTGRLVWVAEVGTVVPRGGGIARTDATQLELQRAELQAGVVREEGRLRFLTREAERLESLLAENIAARSQYERTVNDRDVSRSDLAIQRARLEQVDDQLARTQIRAPFPGVVAERLRQAGERVGIGDAVVRLTSPDELEIVARAPLASVPFLAEGVTLRVEHDGRASSAGIRSLVPFGDARSHLFEIRLGLPGGGSWKAGQAVRVAVPTDGLREVLAVPADALILRREGTSVFRVDAEGKAERVAVVTGAGDGDLVEVSGDLADGDLVVVRGGERLRPGQTVQILEDGASGSASP
jgi:RND family efflux transporter MFP subunit